MKTICRHCKDVCPSGTLPSGLCSECAAERPCSACLNEFDKRTPARLVRGRRYSDNAGRMVIVNRYLCDMHAQDVS
jgi:hypothetical protein